MKQKRYAIIDIETTGGKASRDKITEIAIVLHDGQQIIETYETLINPETYIPYGITQLTGITQDMVADAPKFFEVAKKIVEMTEGAVFVAHSVRFDYSFIREEFQRLGFTYTRKQLCTVRLSRKAFPDLRSYGLDNLIYELDLTIDKRHRAMGDAMATTELFEKILRGNDSEEKISDLVNLGIKEALLPKNLSLETIHALPETCGVYYFHDINGTVVYVGKSINIKKRVAEHFSKKTEKAARLQEKVDHISFEITGSELVALLLESHEIKRLKPIVNRAQRIQHFPFVIYHYTNEAGYLCFEMAKVKVKKRKTLQVVAQYPKLSRAKGHLSRMLNEYELCAKYCNLQAGNGACFNYHIKECHGACVEQESVEDYNERAYKALERMKMVFEEDFLIIDQGRTAEERAIVLVEAGNYKGFGYVQVEELNTSPQELKEQIKSYPGNPETTRLIQRYLSKDKAMAILQV